MQQQRSDAWRGFDGTGWRDDIDVAAFVRDNVRPYLGDAEFLTGPTHRTERIWRQLQRMFVEAGRAATTTS